MELYTVLDNYLEIILMIMTAFLGVALGRFLGTRTNACYQKHRADRRKWLGILKELRRKNKYWMRKYENEKFNFEGWVEEYYYPTKVENFKLKTQQKADSDLIGTLKEENERLQDSLEWANITGCQMVDSIERLNSAMQEINPPLEKQEEGLNVHLETEEQLQIS